MADAPAAGAAHPAMESLRAYALAFPEAYEDFPWGESAFKVRKKVFLFMHGTEGGGLGLSMKLPVSAEMALTFPFAEPTGYGLGRAGWVTCRFAACDALPTEMLREWIAQSYRAVAPKALVSTLPGHLREG